MAAHLSTPIVDRGDRPSIDDGGGFLSMVLRFYNSVRRRAPYLLYSIADRQIALSKIGKKEIYLRFPSYHRAICDRQSALPIVDSSYRR